MWISDAVAGELVRVDPERRAVLARIPVDAGQRIVFEPVGDELWIPSERAPRMLRIDPVTNAALPPRPLRTPGGRPFTALEVRATDGGVWAFAAEGALRLDAASGAPRRLVARATPDDELQGAAASADTVWTLGTSGAIRRFDADGTPRGTFAPGLPDTRFIAAAGSDLVAVDRREGTIALLDGTTGSVRWRRPAGAFNGFDLGGGLLWLHASAARGGDRLEALSLDDGAPVSSTPLDAIGATGMAIVDDEVWVNTPGGRTLVVRR